MSDKTDRLPILVPDASALRDRFEHGRPPTFGVEEEAMVLDPVTFELAPRAAELHEGDWLKLELPASQLEIVGPPVASLGALTEGIRSGRRRAADAVGARAALGCAGVHPFAPAEGALNAGPRYERLAARYGSVARRQLVCALHVHVAIDGAERSLAVYNAMRSHLPDLAALAANAPVHLGAETGMASVRPQISAMLPRQGIPPAFSGWEQLSGALSWLVSSGRISDLGEWWWELRLHPRLGTIEVRVADSQTRARDAAAIAAVAAATVLWLAARHEAGELLEPAPAWRLAENRFSAARHGVAGEMADPHTGAPAGTSERLHALLDQIAPFAAAHGGTPALEDARALLARGGSVAGAREAFATGGAEGLARALAGAFLEGCAPADGPDAGRPRSGRC